MAGVAPMPPSAATWASDLQAKVGHREEAQALEANGEAYTARVPPSAYPDRHGSYGQLYSPSFAGHQPAYAPADMTNPFVPLAQSAMHAAAADWACKRCGYSNFRKRDICKGCGTGRFGTTGLTKTAAQNGRSYGDILAGAFVNYGPDHPLNPAMASGNFSMGSTEVRPGDWTCRDCRFSNFAYRYTCKNCSAPKPDEIPKKEHLLSSQTPRYNAMQQYPLYPAQQQALQYQTQQTYAAQMQQAYAQQLHAAQQHQYGQFPQYAQQYPHYMGQYHNHSQHHRKAGDWLCDACHFSNFAYRFACKNCTAPRKDAPQTPPLSRTDGGHVERPGDWICATCKYSNFAYRDVCNNCSTQKLAQEDAEERSSAEIKERPRSGTAQDAAEDSPDLLLSTLSLLDDTPETSPQNNRPLSSARPTSMASTTGATSRPTSMNGWQCHRCVVNNGDLSHCCNCGNRRSLLESKSDYIRNNIQNASRRSSTSPLESLVMEGRAPRHSMPTLITGQSRVNSIIDPPVTSQSSTTNGAGSHAVKRWICEGCDAENSAMKIRCRDCGHVNLGGAKRPESATVLNDIFLRQ